MGNLIGSVELQECSAIIGDALERQASRLFAPDSRKSDKPLRRFSIKETAMALRMNYNTLRSFLKFNEDVPEGIMEPGNRRTFSLEEIHELQQRCFEMGKIPLGDYPRRSGDDPCAKLVIYNLKGGVSKTTLATNLCEVFAFRGMRVLAIDLDPQSSLSAVFDLRADQDDLLSIYDVLKYDNPVPITEAIQATYFPNLDVVPGSLSMTEFEFETSASFMRGQAVEAWHRKIANALRLAEDYYDVVVFDTPPHMSFAVIAAVYAATGMLIPLSAGMLDVDSLEKFLDLGASTLRVIEEQEQQKSYDFLRFVLTRYSANDPAQRQLSAFLRSNLGHRMLVSDFVNSTAISDAGNTLSPLLEIAPTDFTRKTYDRILESVMGIALELEHEIMTSWGREPSRQEID